MKKVFVHNVHKYPIKINVYYGTRKIYSNSNLSGGFWTINYISAGKHTGLMICCNPEKELYMFCPCGSLQLRDYQNIGFTTLLKLLSKHGFHWINGSTVYYDRGVWSYE